MPKRDAGEEFACDGSGNALGYGSVCVGSDILWGRRKSLFAGNVWGHRADIVGALEERGKYGGERGGEKARKRGRQWTSLRLLVGVNWGIKIGADTFLRRLCGYLVIFI